MNILTYYNEELRYLRESGARFAKEHPQVAGQLGLHPDAVTDPFVERLLEGVAFLSARVHARLDHECAEFAQQALHGLSPLFMTATPSLSCFAFQPDFTSPEAFTGGTVLRGSVVQANFIGRKNPIQFVTAKDVQLLPLRLKSVICSRNLTNIPLAFESKIKNAQGIIRFSFQLEGSGRLSDLKKMLPLKPLNVSVAGDLSNAFNLHHTLLADTYSWFAFCEEDNTYLELPRHALKMSGLDDNQALLPLHAGGMHGLRLLREYFAQPERFLSFDMDIMAQLIKFLPHGKTFDIIFALKQIKPYFIGNLNNNHFRLFATPVINLYPRRLDPVPYDSSKTLQWVPVDRMRPQAHYLWAVREVTVCQRNGITVKAVPSISHAGFEESAARARFGFNRSAVDEMHGARSVLHDPLSSYDTLSISLLENIDDLENVTTLLVRGLVVDRDWLPKALLEAKLSLTESKSVSSIECLWPGSSPRPIPHLEASWNAVSRLCNNPLSITRPGKQDITAQVTAYLSQAAQLNNILDKKRLESIRSIVIYSGQVRLNSYSPMPWLRCIYLSIDIDTSHHSDNGAWLFGRVIAQALSQSVSLNEGIEVKLFLDGELNSTHVNTDRADGVLE